MAIWKKSLMFLFLVLMSASLFAQQSSREAERQLLEAEEQQRAAEVQMREAEEALAAAARQIAELSTKHLPAVVDIERYVDFGGRNTSQGVFTVFSFAYFFNPQPH